MNPLMEEGLALDVTSPHFWCGSGVSIYALRQMVAEVAVEAGARPTIFTSPAMLWQVRFELDDAVAPDHAERVDELLGLIGDRLPPDTARPILELFGLVLAEVRASQRPWTRLEDVEFYGCEFVVVPEMPSNRLVVFAEGLGGRAMRSFLDTSLSP